MTVLEFSDSVHVSADPAAVYALVSDVTRIGEWSSICKACWWDDAAEQGVGAWFTGRNQTPEGRSEATGEIIEEGTWETRSQVVAADAEIQKRSDAALSGIPVTLAAIKATAEAS